MKLPSKTIKQYIELFLVCTVVHTESIQTILDTYSLKIFLYIETIFLSKTMRLV